MSIGQQWGWNDLDTTDEELAFNRMTRIDVAHSTESLFGPRVHSH